MIRYWHPNDPNRRDPRVSLAADDPANPLAANLVCEAPATSHTLTSAPGRRMHESAIPRRTESAADRIEGNGSAATHLQAPQDRTLDLPHQPPAYARHAIPDSPRSPRNRQRRSALPGVATRSPHHLLSGLTPRSLHRSQLLSRPPREALPTLFSWRFLVVRVCLLFHIPTGRIITAGNHNDRGCTSLRPRRLSFRERSGGRASDTSGLANRYALPAD